MSTIAILGQFRAKSGGVLRFGHSNDTTNLDGRLDAASVFAALKPELKMRYDRRLPIDNDVYNAMSLEFPSSDGDVPTIEVRLDNPLLDHSTGNREAHKYVGGRLLHSLLRDLDVCTRFSTSRFSLALLDLAQRYVHVKSNHILAGELKIGSAQTDELFHGLPIISSAILKMLTVFEGDLPAARHTLWQLLQDTENVLTAEDKNSRKSMIDAVVNALGSFRTGVLRAEKIDDAMSAVLGINPDDKYTRDDMDWYGDFSRSEKYYFELGSDIAIDGGSFADYYNHYMDHSENIYRFVRSPVLHSYVFMWLSSKYEDYSQGKFTPTTDAMFTRGVVGAPGWIPDLSREDQIVFAGMAIKATQDEIAAAAGDDKAMISGGQPVADASGAVFEDKNLFSRAALQEILENTFSGVAGSALGALGGVQKAAIEATQRFESHKRTLMGAFFGVEDLSAKQAQQAVEKALKDKLDAEFTKELKSAIGQATPDSLVNDAMEAFAKGVGKRAGQEYVSAYNAMKQTLKNEEADLKALYRLSSVLANRHEQVASTPASANIQPAAVAETYGMEATEQIRSAVQAAQASPPSFQIVRNTSVDAAVQANKDKPIDFTVTSGESVVAKGVMPKDGPPEIIFDRVDFAPEETFSLELPDSLAKDDNRPSLADIDPDGEVRARADKAAEAAKRFVEAEQSVDDLAKYREKRDGLRDVYAGIDGVGRPMEADERKRLLRSMRALTLGEYIAASPDEDTRLGKRDISQTLNLLIDIAAELGDLDNASLFAPGPDDGSARALGPIDPSSDSPRASLDLSKYFKLPNDADQGRKLIGNAMTFHDELCSSAASVRPYLRDLADIAAIAESMPYDGRLLILNMTLDEFGSYLANNNAHLFDLKGTEAIYLANAAQADEGSGAWAKIDKAVAQCYAQRAGPGGGGGSQIPLPYVIPAHSLADGTASAFPIADLGGLSMLIVKPLTDIEPDARSTITDGLIIDATHRPMSMPMAMIAAAQQCDDGALGSLVDAGFSDGFPDEFVSATGVKPYAKEPVIAMLRRVWRGSTLNTCFEAFVLSRLGARMLMRKLGNDVAPTFSTFLREALLEPTETGENDPKMIEAARVDFFESGFIETNEALRLQISAGPKKGGRDLTFATANDSFSQTPAIHVVVEGVEKTSNEDGVALDPKCRQRLTFIGL